ncbi:PilZ domain-containing protein [Sphingobium sp. 3R8]|uniref:PilZ domain-containing protein n=1 Tax=Sphingobium sp. 3R8 TaxID=2874921 RepID=UPI001CC9A9BF|nr:PilZ domain-containing protein [Sphingobium sp. 3R8]
MSSHVNRRVRPRVSVFLLASASGFEHGEPSRHRVRNISSGGVCVDGAEHLRVGQTLMLDIGRLEEIVATVAWTENGLAGMRFAEEIELGDATVRGGIVGHRGKFSPR